MAFSPRDAKEHARGEAGFDVPDNCANCGAPFMEHTNGECPKEEDEEPEWSFVQRYASWSESSRSDAKRDAEFHVYELRKEGKTARYRWDGEGYTVETQKVGV